jgi:hypothetical protein
MDEQMAQIIEQLVEQDERKPREIVQMMIDDGAIPADWIDSRNITTVADAQKFIDAAVDYLDTTTD